MYQLALPYNKPTAQSRWEQEGVDFGERWIHIYRIPFEVTTSTRLQTLQYRIVQRYFPTRRYLYSRRVIDDPFCDDCGLVDSLYTTKEIVIYHYFFECHEVREFWNEAEVKNLVNSSTHVGSHSLCVWESSSSQSGQNSLFCHLWILII